MSAKRPILIVEDDAALREAIAEHFASEQEFALFTAATLGEADAAINAKEAHFDAVILDIGMPDGDGRDFCTKLRQEGHRMPVIMLTGSDGEADVVRGLDGGAADYIVKPFRANELLARLRAQLRIFDNTEDAVFSIGPYTFRPSMKTLRDPKKNRRIKLTVKETAILKYLYRMDASVVDRKMLLGEIWGYSSSVTTHTLETHIYRLRQKIEADPAIPTLLLTEAGGYRLDLEMVSTLGA